MLAVLPAPRCMRPCYDRSPLFSEFPSISSHFHLHVVRSSDDEPWLTRHGLWCLVPCEDGQFIKVSEGDSTCSLTDLPCTIEEQLLLVDADLA
jgi:hypothetical protein